ncbi:hypothetical protein [Phytopseudomonas dryadis]|uniref:Uncharacterized protein n=1 Tax=Phytopseudomonas dryadis TaxID=2487520 RepID=A0A4Q9QU42_9GAMM|nr:hypothetical protein [Pseudomonas dryadis]TBU86781.1 hypothetical protein DNK44_22010 [Pseudomonas dryadis]
MSKPEMHKIATAMAMGIGMHEQFLFKDLLPLVIGHAKRIGLPSEEVASASFLALATILQSRGFDRELLMRAIDAANIPMHGVQETIQ